MTQQVINLVHDEAITKLLLVKENEHEIIFQANTRSEAAKAANAGKKYGFDTSYKLGKSKKYWYVKMSYAADAVLN